MNAGDGAYWAVIAICFVLIGAVLVAPTPSIEQRASALGAIFAALAWVAWRHRRRTE